MKIILQTDQLIHEESMPFDKHLLGQGKEQQVIT
jgi:hypothetical protein